MLFSCAFTASMGFWLSEGKMATFRRVSTVLNDDEDVGMIKDGAMVAE
mgnify:CR=1 FL=1